MNKTKAYAWKLLLSQERYLESIVHPCPEFYVWRNEKVRHQCVCVLYLMLILIFYVLSQLFIAVQTTTLFESDIKIKSHFNPSCANNRRLLKIFAIDMLYQFYLHNQYSFAFVMLSRVVSSNCWGGFVVLVIWAFKIR